MCHSRNTALEKNGDCVAMRLPGNRLTRTAAKNAQRWGFPRFAGSTARCSPTVNPLISCRGKPPNRAGLSTNRAYERGCTATTATDGADGAARFLGERIPDS
jgi:hypothetical protein